MFRIYVYFVVVVVAARIKAQRQRKIIIKHSNFKVKFKYCKKKVEEKTNKNKTANRRWRLQQKESAKRGVERKINAQIIYVFHFCCCFFTKLFVLINTDAQKERENTESYL